MLRKIKKSVAVVLVATFIISMFVIAPNAAETQNPNPVVDTTEYSVEGNNSLGDILADEIEDYKSQKNEADGSYVISDITMNGNAATVTYSAAGNCTVLVAVFDENSDEMLASGRVEASADENSVVVALETDNMPTAFVLRGFMLSDKNEPLSESYFSSMYTTDMQQLLESTVDDFEPERVLNLDEDKSTNFMVYSDDVKKFECTDKVNTISSADKENDTYVFTNADESLKSLKQGDIFVNDDDLDNILIIKVGTISVDGDTVTVTGEETSLEQVFECVKIESSGSLADAEVDESTGSSGITYVGSGKANENSSRKKDDAPVGASSDDGSVGAIDINSSIEYEHEFTFNNEGVDGDDDGGDDDDGWLSVEGTIAGKMGVSGKSEIKIYLSSLGKKEISLVLSASLFYKTEIHGSFKVNPKLPSFKLPLIGNALSIDFTVGFFFEVSGDFEIAFETGLSVGFSYSNEEGFKNLSKAPEADYAMGLENEVTIGFSLDIAAVVVDDEIGQVGYSGTIGLHITASPTSTDMKVEGVTVKHNCNRCVSGDISIELILNPKVNILGKDVLPKLLPEFDFQTKLEWPLSPWHYSFTYGEFGLDLCNHVDCVFTIQVLKSGSPVEGAELNDYWPGAKNVYLGETDSLGMAQITLSGNNTGIYQIHATKGEDEAVVSFYVDDFEDILVRMSGTDWCSLSESGNFKYGTYTVNLSKRDDPEPGTDPYPGTDPNSTDPSSTNPSSTEPTSTEPTEPIIIDSGEFGNKVTWKLWSDGKLYLSGSDSSWGSGFSADSVPWKDYVDIITYVSISGMNKIPSYAFYNCINLETVSLPYGVRNIEEYAFYNCVNLKNIELPYGVYSIASYAFYNCKNLVSFYFPSSIERIGKYAFANCSGFIEVSLRTTEIEDYAFYNCDGIRKLSVDCSKKPIHINGLRNEIDDYVFAECDSLVNLEISGADYYGDHIFENCISLTNVTFSGYVVISSYMFCGCKSLVNMIIPEGVFGFGEYAFADCTSLKSISALDSPVIIGEYAFSGCKSLESVSFPLTSHGIYEGGFYGCSSLKEITLPTFVSSDSSSIAPTEAVIWDKAFMNCTSLESVKFPDGQKEKYDLSGTGIFCGCTSLKNFDIPDHTTVIGVGWFDGCTSLTSIKFPDNLMYIEDYAFYKSGLTSAMIPKGVLEIEGHAFAYCKNLTSLALSKNTDVSGHAFENTPVENTYMHCYYEDDNGVGASPCDMEIASNKAEIVSTSSQNLSADADVSKITAEYKKAANAKYIIAVVKDETFEDVLSADNLLYITQVTSDKYGEISVSMPVSAKVTDYDVVIFGPERSDDTPDKPIKGDVDGNGKVTVDDVTAIQKYAADTLKFDDVQIEAADVDGNGKVNIDDVTMIQKYIADMIPSLG